MPAISPGRTATQRRRRRRRCQRDYRARRHRGFWRGLSRPCLTSAEILARRKCDSEGTSPGGQQDFSWREQQLRREATWRRRAGLFRVEVAGGCRRRGRQRDHQKCLLADDLWPRVSGQRQALRGRSLTWWPSQQVVLEASHRGLPQPVVRDSLRDGIQHGLCRHFRCLWRRRRCWRRRHRCWLLHRHGHHLHRAPIHVRE
mmetsp:Transcript_13376/g.23981  ORF Transcript_13376/g.23981 Transcript_13376/m.23981 type:complete len:201 (+) Transcript_13376:257-859(+)